MRFNLDEITLFKPRYNVAPTQQAPVVTNREGTNRAEQFKWGLVPPWAKDISVGNRMINARAETLATKPSFSDLLNNRRCLVLASGFYEWLREAKGKVPMWFKLKTGRSFVFAGLWDSWKQPDGSMLRTFTIITTESNALLLPIHNRMPVMLSDNDALAWIKSDEPGHALSLLKPFPAELMDGYDVSELVNNPQNESAKCIAPVNGG
jgi:putative SOS response-associated peptidase YedK